MPEPDPYSTHLPILKRLKPKRVLEFGTGQYSTKAFLEMDSVTKLVSVETDSAWREKVAAQFSDKRWTLQDDRRIPPLTDFDLIFIDDGYTPQERKETIAYVLRQEHPKVVIHDAEVYLEKIREFADEVKVHDKLEPATAVVPAS